MIFYHRSSQYSLCRTAEEQRGALVEVGMAYGLGKAVYAVGKSKSIAPNEISDVALLIFTDGNG